MFNIRFDASWSPRSSDENLNSLAACILKLFKKYSPLFCFEADRRGRTYQGFFCEKLRKYVWLCVSFPNPIAFINVLLELRLVFLLLATLYLFTRID
jgi:hypothetical protein